MRLTGLRELALSSAILVTLAACATPGGPEPGRVTQWRGTSGPVAWEVVDLRQETASDGREIRWYYTLVLKETQGAGVQFEKVETGVGGPGVNPNISQAQFQRHLDANGELRVPLTSRLYLEPATSASFGAFSRVAFMEVTRRYRGKTDKGQDLVLDVRLRLDVARAGSLASKMTEEQRPPAEAPVWNVGDEWAFRWESSQGKGTFVWTVVREERVGEIDCYVIKTGSREIYYRKTDLASYMETVSGQVDLRRTPPNLLYVWPLAVATRWEQAYQVERPRDRQTEDVTTTSIVERAETVTVPAGTFLAYKVVHRNKRTDAITLEDWYSPEAKQWVRDRAYFSYGARTRELTRLKLG